MLTEDALKCSPTREGVPSSEPFTADDLVAAQDELEREAREVLPFSFSQCTYDLGYIRQPLYACLTCLNNCAVCAACSISCHGEHHLVELFNRRNARCDCGTSRMGAGSRCGISARDDAPPNKGNRYDKNFRGEFCFCGAHYDPQTETDSMYQCVVCEDWLHHSCLLGAPADSNDSPLGEDDFDQVICGNCIKTDRDGCRRVIERYAGREDSGFMLVGGESGHEILGRAFLPLDSDDQEPDVSSAVPEAPAGGEEATSSCEKRKTEDTALGGISDEPTAKRARIEASSSQSESDAKPTESAEGSTTSPSTSQSTVLTETSDVCKAPLPIPNHGLSPIAKEEQRGRLAHVFLEEGWQMRWCRCSKCLPFFHQLPYMLEEEETYEPPDDPDAHKSTLELGMDALARMPRAQAIEGALAFQGLSERLKAYLRPYSEQGVTVTTAVVEEFFEREKEALLNRR